MTTGLLFSSPSHGGGREEGAGDLRGHAFQSHDLLLASVSLRLVSPMGSAS